MIGSLQSLRFIFAIMIFLHHFTGNGGVGLFEAGGSCGVSFFMILSGFVMSVGYFEKVQLPSFNYTSFIGKRLIRVYPLHFVFNRFRCFDNFDINAIWLFKTDSKSFVVAKLDTRKRVLLLG